jgi:sulfotransferase
MKTYHFISGLPRSGSTLLSSILKQNPRFTASISDPLASYVSSIIRDTNTAVGMDAAVSIEKRREMIRDLFDSFYKNDNEVCFNTNRGWSASTSLLKDLFPNFKMIVCVRDVPWILDSFEQLNAKNPYTIKPLYHHQELGNVHDRCRILMGEVPNFGGYVHGPLINVQQSMFCNEVNQICYVDYEILVRFPKQSMKQIYQFLGEPWYDHDFNNVEDSYDEFDEQAKISGLHTVRRKVEFQERRSVLPGELWDKYSPMSFWKSMSAEQTRLLNWITSGTQQLAQPRKPIVPTLGRQL